MTTVKHKKRYLFSLIIVLAVSFAPVFFTSSAFAAFEPGDASGSGTSGGTSGGVTTPSGSTCTNTAVTSVCVRQPQTKYQCGSGTKAVTTSINFGCYGEKCATNCSALVDATFAIIRFLSATVGLIIIGSTIWAGIQYASARDDPSAVGKAKSRISSNLLALLLFIFGYAILNFVIPAGFFLK